MTQHLNRANSVEPSACQGLTRLSKLCDVKVSSDEDLEPPVWLFRELFYEGSVGMICAGTNKFKSFIANYLAWIISTGSAFNGKKAKQGLVVYIDYEGQNNFFVRVRGLEKLHERLDIDNIAQIRTDLMLSNSAIVEELIHSINEWAASKELEVRMIVVDTLSRAASDLDENNSGHMSKFLGRLKKISLGTGAAVLVLHHPGKGNYKGPRGSSAIPGGFDFVLLVESNVKNKTFVLEVMKQREGPSGQRFEGVLEELDIGINDDGEPFKTLAVKRIERLPDKTITGSVTDLAAELLTKFLKDSGYETEKQLKTRVCFELKAAEPSATDVAIRARCNRALHKLIEEQVVSRENEMIFLSPRE